MSGEQKNIHYSASSGCVGRIINRTVKSTSKQLNYDLKMSRMWKSASKKCRRKRM
jgi:hypothetical protein